MAVGRGAPYRVVMDPIVPDANALAGVAAAKAAPRKLSAARVLVRLVGGSFAGWLVELAYTGKPQYSGVIGEVPLLPIYGVGLVLLAYASCFLRRYVARAWLRGLALGAGMVVFEEACGLLGEAIFSVRLWDYGNSLHYVDLRHAIWWLVAGLAFEPLDDALFGKCTADEPLIPGPPTA